MTEVRELAAHIPNTQESVAIVKKEKEDTKGQVKFSDKNIFYDKEEPVIP